MNLEEGDRGVDSKIVEGKGRQQEQDMTGKVPA